MPTAGRTGRRPGKPDTRGDILAAARDLFVAQGYEQTSVRAVARAAGVDPALVHRWFDGKSGLLMGVLAVEMNPLPALRGAFAGDPRRLGDRLARAVLNLWTSPMGKIAAGSLRESPELVTPLVEFVNEPLLEVARSGMDLGEAEARMRVALLESIIVGFATARMVSRLEPIASLPQSELTDVLAPLIQHALTGPLPRAALRHHLPATQ